MKSFSKNLRFLTIADPDGHNPALRLQGDWLVAAISDGEQTGYGEASHSGDDRACQERMRSIFEAELSNMPLSMKTLQSWEAKIMRTRPDFITATAISALNQACHDLLARQIGAPVWKLYRTTPQRESISFYATINRALRKRTVAEYLNIVGNAKEGVITKIKCAPFEAVNPRMNTAEQSAAAEKGLQVLKALREAFPEMGMRVDFHNRFHMDAFLKILPTLENLSLDWIEEPCIKSTDFKVIRQSTEIPLAAGELFFGSRKFIQLMKAGQVDVVMPDIKHVGGFGPLLEVCREADKRGVQVSPHNPAGAVASAASLQTAAISRAVSSIEVPLLSSRDIPLGEEWRQGTELRIPQGSGWGIKQLI